MKKSAYLSKDYVKKLPVDKLRTLAALSVIDQRVPRDLIREPSTILHWRNCSDPSKKSHSMEYSSIVSIACYSKRRKDMETYYLITGVHEHGPANIFDSFSPSSLPNEFDLVSKLYRNDALDYSDLHEIHTCKQMSQMIEAVLRHLIFPTEEDYLQILSWVVSCWMWEGKIKNHPAYEVEIVNISNILIDLVVKCRKILAAYNMPPAIFIHYLLEQASKTSGFSEVAVMAVQMAEEKNN